MSKPQILILGAGKSATVLIQYLQKKAVENNWYIVLADADKNLAETKWNNAKNGHAIGFDIEDDSIRASYIQSADLVVSMMPAYLHFLVAKDCLNFSKPLFTASYVDENMQSLAKAVKEKNILFLCEMGLDPGIDHMSAMDLIHRIQNKGGIITHFKSHCGGLIAPESDDNPWHYKISWNPRNIILAGKLGGQYLENGEIIAIPYENLFHNTPTIQIPSIGNMSYYPNRNALPYMETYALKGIPNFVRTTLRYSSFCKGWDWIIQLKLTDETPLPIKENMTLKEWFFNHLQVNELTNLYLDLLQQDALKILFDFMGFDESIIIPTERTCSNASILQWHLERKWKLNAGDKDMVVMMHEIEYSLGTQKHKIQSSLVVKGINETETAMARTVGLPLAMGVCTYLKGAINLTGIQIPIHPSIYHPILNLLKEEGIAFMEIAS